MAKLENILFTGKNKLDMVGISVGSVLYVYLMPGTPGCSREQQHDTAW